MKVRPRLTGCAAVVGGAAAWWAIRHVRSPAVRRWRPSTIRAERVGALHVRHAGRADPVVVLLHGLVATGEIFGAAFDPVADTATLVVPDLLGFGRSLDESRTRFEPEDHLDTLDEMLTTLGLEDRPILVGAHSMGGSVAIRWARRRGPQVTRIVCWGVPIYPDPDAVDRALGDAGLMARLFVANTAWARRACRINCAHRRLAGLAATAMRPSLPISIARSASLHTWPAYRDAMTELVTGTDWPAEVQAVSDAGTTVALAWGSQDLVGDLHYARTLRGASVDIVEGAGHHLPLTHGNRCRAQLLETP